jgi:CHAT domain-containing protein/Tfp pilus assembly protein PilF
MSKRGSSFALVLALAMLWVIRAFAEVDALDQRLDAAVTVYRQDGAGIALPQFQRLAEKFRAQGLHRDEAAAVHYVGECYWRLGRFSEARTQLDKALELERAHKDRHGEGKTLNVIGLLEWDLGDYDRAIENFRSAGAVGHELGDRKLEGASLNNLSLVYDELGDYETSLSQYRQVLEIYRDADFPRGEGDTLGNIGGVYLLLGRYRDALGYYQQALTISQRLKSKPSMSQDEGNIALSLLGLGEIDSALEHFDRAIELTRQTGMRQDEAYWLCGKGNALMEKGRYDQGLDLHRTALAIYEDVGAKAELLEALHDMGRLYLLLGDPDSADRYFARALDLAQSIGLSRGITLNLIALGDLQFRRERYEDAAKYYDQARQRAAESDARQHLATSLLRLALVRRQQAHMKDAQSEVDRALGISREIGARPIEAEALFAQGDLSRRQGHIGKALEEFSAAEAALASIGDPDLQWQIYFGRALAYETQGDRTAAIDSLLAAVNLIEGIRSRLREERFRAGYVEDKYEVYIELVRLQLEDGRTADAFSTAERLRARSYAEQLGGRYAAPLSDDDRRTEIRLRERIRQLHRAIADEENEVRPGTRQRAMVTFSRELVLAEREYQAFLDDHASAVLPEGAPGVHRSASSVQDRLGDDEALVEYVVGRDGIIGFVLTHRSVFATAIPIRRADLNARIALLRDLIRHPGDKRWAMPAASLAAALLDPLEKGGWLLGVRQLYIVPHGVLNYLPFSLLPRGGSTHEHLLIDDFTVAYLPAATALLNDTPAADGPQSLLAMAPARSHLRYAPEEARSVDALFEPNSQLLVGNSATESRFKAIAGDYRILHLATHGYFNKLNPLLSGLELEADGSDDGLLQVHEVLALHLVADLVTLSACETALGSGYFADVPAGDEFVGITRAFLAAGSASVMATLWDVDDRSSVELMKRFYQHLNEPEYSRDEAGALARTQRELHSSDEFGHPYFWAPYILVGAMGQTADRKTLTVGR